MIDLGVDNLITDQPLLAREIVGEYANLSRPERALRQVRAWISN